MLLRLEILVFLFSFFYIAYYIADIVYAYIKVRQERVITKLQKREEIEQKREIIEIQKIQAPEEEPVKTYISPEASEQIREIAKRAQVHISRGYLESARSLIVEGLALKKHDKQLNFLLADVYEREKKYEHASYVYEDVLELFPDDQFALEKLGNIYALMNENEKALEMYDRALKKNKSNTEILDIMAHLALEIKDYKKSLKTANLYLKEKPRNAEKLWIKGYCLEKLGKIPESITAYKKILEIQPYNTEIQDRIKKLESFSSDTQ